MIQVERRASVAIVMLSRPKVNALSPELVTGLQDCVDGLYGDDGVGALVLASALEGVFCGGFDLKLLNAMEPDLLADFLERFARLYRDLAGGPKPVVAAVGGHAIAGGAILALACDRRIFGAGSWRFGVNEVDLALPLPPGVIALLRETAPGRHVLEAAALGMLYAPEEAAGAGFADRLVQPGQVLEVAVAEATAFADKPRRALGFIRAGIRSRLRRELAEADAEVGDLFRAWWFGAEATERRRAVLEKLESRNRPAGA